MTKPVPTIRDKETTLVMRETWNSASGQHSHVATMRYSAGDMLEIFNDDERNALARGFQVIRHAGTVETIFVDAIQAALARGL